jgi:hypothetical protein
MTPNLKKVASFLLIATIVLGIAQVAHAASLVGDIACSDDGNCTPCDFIQIFVNASNILVGLSGTFAVLMFAYGGIVMITAYGNENRITWGKNVLIATITGIGLVLFAWTLVNILIGSLFGSTNPSLPSTGVPWHNSTGACADR